MTRKHPTCETCKHWGDHYGGDWPFLTDDGDNPCEVTERDFYCSMHSEVTDE